MCYVYILRSARNKKRYIGSTGKDVQQRLVEHNSGSNQWTRQNGPFVLVYVEDSIDIKEARQKERFLKSGQGRQCLDELNI